MALGRKLGLDPSDIVGWGPHTPSLKREQSPQFSANVYYGQTAGWIKMPLGTMVGLSTGNTVFDAEPAPPVQGHSLSQFSSHVCCGQISGWIMMALGTKVGLGPGHIVLHGDPDPPSKKEHNSSIFGPRLLAKRSPISATAEHLYKRSPQNGTPSVTAMVTMGRGTEGSENGTSR